VTDPLLTDGTLVGERSFSIACWVCDFGGFQPGYAVVAVDVIRATTMVLTAQLSGRRCFPAATIDSAVQLAKQLDQPLLAGELGGNKPYGFDLDNSPADVAQRADVERPLVLVSTSGTQLICDAGQSAPVTYAACLRNFSAQARHLATRHTRVALIGAGSRGQFREEDQLCCAWIGQHLMEAGFTPEGDARAIVERWRGAPVTEILNSNSAHFLRSTGRERDLDFVLEHVDDSSAICTYNESEIVKCS
jgi:2-phosphosulfolactate phosphatase